MVLILICFSENNLISLISPLVLDPGSEHGVPLQADRDHPGQLRLLLGLLHRPDRGGQIPLYCSPDINPDLNSTGCHQSSLFLIDSISMSGLRSLHCCSLHVRLPVLSAVFPHKTGCQEEPHHWRHLFILLRGQKSLN